MGHRINRPALDRFIAEQVDVLEAMPVPADVAALTQAGNAAEGLTADELRAVWLGAGLASRVGLSLLEEPERFVTAAPAAAID